jgi:cell division protein ZipA
MQELRFVLIIVGVLAISALLLHGIWTSKKEGKAKFSDKPLGKIKTPKKPEVPLPDDEDVKLVTKPSKKEPSFGLDQHKISDPLLNDEHDSAVIVDDSIEQTFDEVIHHDNDEPLPSITIDKDAFDDDFEISAPRTVSSASPSFTQDDSPNDELNTASEPVVAEEPEKEPEMQVIVLHVHALGDEEFVGTELFTSMENNGLRYGEMDIFHRHVDMSGTGPVLFSVANMMQPGTLAHDDPATFTTKGISFFMTLPCYGEAEQTFKIMLTTAQKIANDLGGNVLDEQRNMTTPDRLKRYRKQVQEFDAQQSTAS